MGKVRVIWCDSNEARAYVESRKWESLSGSPKLFTRHRGNNVWRADVPPFGQVVIKESHLDPSFSLLERIGGELRFRLLNVNLRDARMALAAERLGVATYHPLAVWEVRMGLLTSCYIMYTYVEGRSLDDIFRRGGFDEADRPDIKRYLHELGQMARRLHEGGLRHRDLVPANILVRPDDSLAIIDFASGYPVHRRQTRSRRAQNFASLRRLAHILDVDCLTAFSEGYCGANRGQEYEHSLLSLLYWKYNGHRSKGWFHRLGFWKGAIVANMID